MKKHYTFILLIVNLLGWIGSASGQTSNRPKPPQLPNYNFYSQGEAVKGFYFNAPFDIGGVPPGTPQHLMMLDSGGYVFWYAPVATRNIVDFKYHPEHKVYSFIKFQNPTNAQFMVMNEAFQIVDSFTTVNGILPDTHDFLITSNGNYIVTGASDSIFDLSAYMFNGAPGSATTHCQGFVVQEFDSNHNLLFEWDSNDHIFPTEALPAYGYSATNFDYCHGNTVSEDSDGNLLLSFRHLNAVYKINHTTGEVMWRLSGKSSSFTFTNADRFSGQHDVRRLPNGNISIFDNANTAQAPKKSRAVEYQLDTVSMIATKVWEYIFDPAFFAIAMGSHQTTDTRDHIIGYGLVYRPNPSFLRVSDAGEVKQELLFEDSVMSYRSYWFDVNTDNLVRPVITCIPSNTGIVLSATGGYSAYQWSTGAKTLTINITQPGEYQVWANYGIGMLGSEPITITDPSQGCPTSSTSEPGTIANGKTIYVDLLGRVVDAPVRGNLYWQKSANGQVKMILFE